MDVRHLRYFVALAERRHFGRAAEALNIAQPPLSQQIKALEEELGVALFDRSMRPIELTAAGKVLLREARQILQQIARAQAVTRRAGRGQEGHLVIGITGSAAVEFLPPVLARFGERCPEVNLSVREMSSPDQLMALETGEIHIAFVRPPVIAPKLTIQLVHQEPFLVALPSTHALAEHEAIRLADLGDTPLILFDAVAAPGFHDMIMHLCRTAGYAPPQVQEARQMLTMLSMVAARLGVALVPRAMRRLVLDGVTFRPLLDDAPPIDLYVAWPSDKRNALIEELLLAVEDARIAAQLCSDEGE